MNSQIKINSITFSKNSSTTQKIKTSQVLNNKLVTKISNIKKSSSGNLDENSSFLNKSLISNNKIVDNLPKEEICLQQNSMISGSSKIQSKNFDNISPSKNSDYETLKKILTTNALSDIMKIVNKTYNMEPEQNNSQVNLNNNLETQKQINYIQEGQRNKPEILLKNNQTNSVFTKKSSTNLYPYKTGEKEINSKLNISQNSLVKTSIPTLKSGSVQKFNSNNNHQVRHFELIENINQVKEKIDTKEKLEVKETKAISINELNTKKTGFPEKNISNSIIIPKRVVKVNKAEKIDKNDSNKLFSYSNFMFEKSASKSKLRIDINEDKDKEKPNEIKTNSKVQEISNIIKSTYNQTSKNYTEKEKNLGSSNGFNSFLKQPNTTTKVNSVNGKKIQITNIKMVKVPIKVNYSTKNKAQINEINTDSNQLQPKIINNNITNITIINPPTVLTPTIKKQSKSQAKLRQSKKEDVNNHFLISTSSNLKIKIGEEAIEKIKSKSIDKTGKNDKKVSMVHMLIEEEKKKVELQAKTKQLNEKEVTHKIENEVIETLRSDISLNNELKLTHQRKITNISDKINKSINSINTNNSVPSRTEKDKEFMKNEIKNILKNIPTKSRSIQNDLKGSNTVSYGTSGHLLQKKTGNYFNQSANKIISSSKLVTNKKSDKKVLIESHSLFNVFTDKKLQNNKNHLLIEENYLIEMKNKNKQNTSLKEDNIVQLIKPEPDLKEYNSNKPSANNSSVKIKRPSLKPKLISNNFVILMQNQKIKQSVLNYLTAKDTFSIVLTNKKLKKEILPLSRKKYLQIILENNDNLIRLKIWKSIFYYSSMYYNNKQLLYKENLNLALEDKKEFELMKTHNKKDVEKFTYILQIEKDITRTFPKNPSFKGLEIQRLQNILLAYAKFNEKIGYAQGMNFIAAASLLLFKDESECFCFLDSVITKFNLDKLLAIKNSVGKVLEEFDLIVKKFCPKLVKFLKENYLTQDFISTQWLITLFSSSMEPQQLFKFWDIMLLFDWKFVLYFTVSILKEFENIICTWDQFALSSNVKSLLKTDLFTQSFEHIIFRALELIDNLN